MSNGPARLENREEKGVRQLKIHHNELRLGITLTFIILLQHRDVIVIH
jgi:hypothetical protein